MKERDGGVEYWMIESLGVILKALYELEYFLRFLIEILNMVDHLSRTSCRITVDI